MVSRFSCKKIDIAPQYSDISNFRRLIIQIPEHHIFEIRQGKHYLEGTNENDMNVFNQQFFYKEQEIYISAEDFKEIIQLVMDLGKHLDMTHLNKMTKHCQQKETNYTCSAFRGYAFIRLYTKNFYLVYHWDCLDINSLHSSEKLYFDKILHIMQKIQTENEAMQEINQSIHSN